MVINIKENKIIRMIVDRAKLPDGYKIGIIYCFYFHTYDSIIKKRERGGAKPHPRPNYLFSFVSRSDKSPPTEILPELVLQYVTSTSTRVPIS